jgi:hypothetical protein
MFHLGFAQVETSCSMLGKELQLEQLLETFPEQLLEELLPVLDL